MNIKDLDLNLLRLFDAVWRSRSVSLAAQQLGMSQPAASQGLARLRALLGDALFERSGSGVRPTPRADRLAQGVQVALATIEEALNASQVFDPQRSARVLRVHLSDIGEARFLPELVLVLQRLAPGMRLEARPVPHDQIGAALDNGQLDLAIGFLPEVNDTLHQPLLSDRYVVLMRQGHPVAKRWGQLQKKGWSVFRCNACLVGRVGICGCSHPRRYPAHFGADALASPPTPDGQPFPVTAWHRAQQRSGGADAAKFCARLCTGRCTGHH